MVVQGTDIVYTADPNASGRPFGLDYTLSNAFGTSQPAHVTLAVNPRPVAPALTAKTMAGVTVQVDLTTEACGARSPLPTWCPSHRQMRAQLRSVRPTAVIRWPSPRGDVRRGRQGHLHAEHVLATSEPGTVTSPSSCAATPRRIPK